MKFTEAKKDSDIDLAGIKADIEWHGAQAKAVLLTDVNGRTVRIAKGESYSSLDILVPAPPVMLDRFRVSGKIPSIDSSVLEYHEYEHDANARVREIDAAILVKHDVKVEKVSVSEEEAEAHPASKLKAEIEAAIPF